MTARRIDDATTSGPKAKAKAAETRETKGSVQEAIGKLIGDDAALDRGTAEKNAGAADASRIRKSKRP